MKLRKSAVVGALALGVLGVSFAWYLAGRSPDVSTAKKYLVEDVGLAAKYSPIAGGLVMGFRVSATSGGTSRVTFLADTSNGYRVITLLVDKRTNPWTIKEVGDN